MSASRANANGSAHAARRSLLAGLGGLAGWLVARPAAARPVHGPILDLLPTHLTSTDPAVLGGVRPGDRLELRRQPANSYDPRTVLALAPDGRQLGLIARIDNKAVASLLDAGMSPFATVTTVDSSGPRPEVRVEVHLPLQTIA